jgi:invasion protein IalB
MKWAVLSAIRATAKTGLAIVFPMVVHAQGEPHAGGVVTGAGFFVAEDGFIVTNNHVIHGCSSVSIRTDDGQRVMGKIAARDIKNDLALIRSSARVQKVARIRTSVRLGEEIAAFGFPHSGLLASTGSFTTGNVTALAGLGDDVSSLQMSAPVQAGNSGGPLLDQSGNLIGVVTAKLGLNMISATGDLPQNVNFAIKASLVATFLDAKRVTYMAASEPSPMTKPDLADYAKSISVFLSCVSSPREVFNRQPGQPTPKEGPFPPPEPALLPRPGSPPVIHLKPEPSNPSWTKVCDKDADQRQLETCYTTRDFVSSQGQPALAIAAYQTSGLPLRVVRFLVPNNLELAAGVHFAVDRAQAIVARYTQCSENGCFAESVVKEEVIRQLTRGTTLHVGVQTSSKREVTFAVPLTGFREAFHGPAIDPKVLEQQRQRLEEELKRREMRNRH